MVPVARAFGMDVLAWSPNLTDEVAAAAGAVRVDKDELFRRSDVVSLHLVLSERSRGTVGREELALLGPHGYLVNTSRSGLVDGTRCWPRCTRGRSPVRRLDVFDVEPVPPDDPLLTAPRTV
jgi:phosphoglycerate dehydrogenase-like enzyme